MLVRRDVNLERGSTEALTPPVGQVDGVFGRAAWDGGFGRATLEGGYSRAESPLGGQVSRAQYPAPVFSGKIGEFITWTHNAQYYEALHLILSVYSSRSPHNASQSENATPIKAPSPHKGL